MLSYIYSLFRHTCDNFHCAVQVDGGQHDDEQAKYFAKKHGPSAQVIDQMNKFSSKEEMEGIAGLEGQQMEDCTKVIYRFQLSYILPNLLLEM